jgi:hypothetical protein
VHSPLLDEPGIDPTHSLSYIHTELPEPIAVIPGKMPVLVLKGTLSSILYEQEHLKLYTPHPEEFKCTCDDVGMSPRHEKKFLASLKVLMSTMFRGPNKIKVRQWHTVTLGEVLEYVTRAGLQVISYREKSQKKQVLLKKNSDIPCNGLKQAYQ